jgi:hypothetical protein
MLPHAIPSGSHWLHGQAFSVYLAFSAQAQSHDDTSGAPLVRGSPYPSRKAQILQEKVPKIPEKSDKSNRTGNHIGQKPLS